MNPDKQLEQDLARLGALMKPKASFTSRVMDQIEQPKTPGRATKHRWWMPVGLSIAASVLIAFGWIALMNRTTPIAAKIDAPTTPRLMQTTTEWQTISDRAITLDGEVPAREIRRQEFDRMKWVDSDKHTTFERLVPRKNPVTLVTMESY